MILLRTRLKMLCSFLALAALGVFLVGCGKLPADPDPPNPKKNVYPRTYPAPETDFSP